MRISPEFCCAPLIMYTFLSEALIFCTEQVCVSFILSVFVCTTKDVEHVSPVDNVHLTCSENVERPPHDRVNSVKKSSHCRRISAGN